MLLAPLILGCFARRLALSFAISARPLPGCEPVETAAAEHWLRHRSVEDPPDFRGIWGEVVAVVRLHLVASDFTSG